MFSRDFRDRFAISITFETKNSIVNISAAILFTIDEIFNESDQISFIDQFITRFFIISSNVFMIFYTFHFQFNDDDFTFKQKKSFMNMFRNVLSIIISQKIEKHQINKNFFIDFIADSIFISFSTFKKLRVEKMSYFDSNFKQKKISIFQRLNSFIFLLSMLKNTFTTSRSTTSLNDSKIS